MISGAIGRQMMFTPTDSGNTSVSVQ